MRASIVLVGFFAALSHALPSTQAFCVGRNETYDPEIGCCESLTRQPDNVSGQSVRGTWNTDKDVQTCQ
ncbi:hypothetical protein N7512_002334 [Penicillium capsulatum]|nr:hypothetical protein N7512_002334 [Penicillium capsulatum]